MDTEALREIFGTRYEAVTTAGARALAELALPLDAAVLDVGTGKGNFAIFLALHGYQVLTGEPATDHSHYAGRDWESNAERAGVRGRIRFQAFDASRMPFVAGEFHAVFFYGVLHHIPEELRRAVLSEALRVLRPGGAVVFFEPRPEMLEHIRLDDPDHPPVANPSSYLADGSVREHRIGGPWMDIFLYRKAAPPAQPSALA